MEKVIRVWNYNMKRDTVRVSYQRVTELENEKIIKSVHPKSKEAKSATEEKFMQSYNKSEQYKMSEEEFFKLATKAYRKTLQVRDKMQHHQNTLNMEEEEKVKYYEELIRERFIP